ncbi:MAG: lipoyl synthase [Parachlamydiaceae bacterium]|nr:lipoyl synthase [Parachlamydiaceae bacterium]
MDNQNQLPSSRKTRLNILPDNPQEQQNEVVGPGRFPSWLHRRLPKGNELIKTNQILSGQRLHTVCEEAKCPNLLECWSKKTATFLVMGKECTRNCGFCSIDFSKKPKDLEKDEPQRVAQSVKELGLRHVVITMVARDDLLDGGSAHLVEVMNEIRKLNPESTIEVLTSDFNGNQQAWQTVIQAQPNIFNHNIETVRELTPRVRHHATYERTLEFLNYITNHRNDQKLKVKSGLMVGLGETEEQVLMTLKDLKEAGCDIVTIGQYLQPHRQKLLVKQFVTPEQFKKYEEYGYEIGLSFIYSGPFIRSSYNAHEVFEKALKV